MNSFVRLVQYLFTINGVEIFLSSKLNQDVLEKYFGIMRQNRGSNENPTISEFKDITRVGNSVLGMYISKRWQL